MTDPDSELDQQIEAYRDGMGSDEERRRFAERIASEPELVERMELAARIDESLRRSFAPPAVDTSFLQGHFQNDSNTEADAPEPAPAATKRSSRRSRAVFLALAASVAWIVVAAQLIRRGDDDRQIAFRERPLTELYTECVAEGFKPYWVCEDDVLFAATFERRQGVPLVLQELPAGRRMVGLSYLAGISRKSTSLLAMADDVPVVVFIDRLDRDWKPPVGDAPDSDLSVKRVERLGLVFYEVSPFEEAYFVDYFTKESEQTGEQDSGANPE